MFLLRKDIILKVIVLLGKSGTGKTTILKKLQEKRAYNIVLQVTDRPMRSNERDLEDYDFVTKDVMKSLIKNDKLIVSSSFNVINNGKNDIWTYGISKNSFDYGTRPNILISDIDSLPKLKEYFGKNLLSIIINSTEDDIIKRIMSRSNYEIEEVHRRMKDDNFRYSLDKTKEVDVHVFNFWTIDKVIKEIEERIEDFINE